jgi:hypothetical protein
MTCAPQRHSIQCFGSLKTLPSDAGLHSGLGVSPLWGDGGVGTTQRVGTGETPSGGRGNRASLVTSYRIIQTFQKSTVSAKRRSFWFYWSRDRLKEVVDLGLPLDLSKIVYGFERWLEDFKDRYVHLSSGNKHVFIRCINRFCKAYKKRLKKRLRFLDFVIWDIKIELTIDPKKFFKLYDEFVFINRAWNKLRSWLKKRYGDFEFLRVLEVTKKGRPHLHVLISGIKWIDQAELSEIWEKYGGGEVVYIKRVYNRNNVKVCRYVLKYVNKTLNRENREFSALLFASNRRLFGLSKSLQNMINVGKNGSKRKLGFVYEGLVYRSELEIFLKGKGLILADYLFIEADFKDYYEFPNLFGVDDG